MNNQIAGAGRRPAGAAVQLAALAALSLPCALPARDGIDPPPAGSTSALPVLPRLCAPDPDGSIGTQATTLAQAKPVSPRTVWLTRDTGASGPRSIDSGRESSGIRIRDLVALVGSVVTGALGYLNYLTRSLRPEQRTSSALARLFTGLFREEPYFPANRNFLKISMLNHLAVLGLGIMAAAQSGQSLMTMVAPAVFALGSLACYPFGTYRPVNRWLKGCEALAFGAIGCLVAANIPASSGWLQSTIGINPVLIGIGAALIARTLAIVPLVLDPIRAITNPDPSRGFPPLKNLILWNFTSLFSLLALRDFHSLGAVVPLGYVAQNTICLGIFLECYRRWRRR